MPAAFVPSIANSTLIDYLVPCSPVSYPGPSHVPWPWACSEPRVWLIQKICNPQFFYLQNSQVSAIGETFLPAKWTGYTGMVVSQHTASCSWTNTHLRKSHVMSLHTSPSKLIGYKHTFRTRDPHMTWARSQPRETAAELAAANTSCTQLSLSPSSSLWYEHGPMSDGFC